MSQPIHFKELKKTQPFVMNNDSPKESHLPVTLVEGRPSERAKILNWIVTFHSVLWEKVYGST